MYNLTSRQELVLVVSGRKAVILGMSFDLEDQLQALGNPRSRNDEFVAVLRDHFRHHMGGVQVEGHSSPTAPRDSASTPAAPDQARSRIPRTLGEIAADLARRRSDDETIAGIMVSASGEEFE